MSYNKNQFSFSLFSFSSCNTYTRIILVLFLCFFNLVYSAEEETKIYIYAKCELIALSNYNITGVITFKQNYNGGNVQVNGEVSKLLNSKQGFTIHENKLSTEDCSGIGNHYNPYSVSHGGRDKDTTSRHLGDLGNIDSTNFEFSDSLISLQGQTSIIDRTCAIHLNEDDLGLGEGESATNGNSGEVVTCGLIVETDESSIMRINLIFLFTLIYLLS